jgi:hypothetical protein
MDHPRGYPNELRMRRAARAAGAVGGANFNTVQLWNNSSGRDVLVVRAIQITTPAGGDKCLAAYTQTQLSGLVMGGVALVTGDQQPPGQTYQQSLAAPLTADYYLGFTVNNYYWQHDFPFAALQPGWGLNIALDTIGQSIFVSFLYEAVPPDAVH